MTSNYDNLDLYGSYSEGDTELSPYQLLAQMKAWDEAVRLWTTAELDLRVAKDGIISAINLSPEEIRIDTSRLAITGLVTIEAIAKDEGVTMIHGGNIISKTITADAIAANAITANEINVASLNGISITGLFLQGGYIQGGFITSDTSIQVTKDAYIGDNLYLGWDNTLTGGSKSIWFDYPTGASAITWENDSDTIVVSAPNGMYAPDGMIVGTFADFSNAVVTGLNVPAVWG